MDYLEFIALLTSHIPDKGQVTVLLWPLRQRPSGKARKAGANPSALRKAEQEEKPVFSKGWAARLTSIIFWRYIFYVFSRKNCKLGRETNRATPTKKLFCI